MLLTTLLALLKTMRPKQWAKNGFLFAALFFDRQFRPDNLPAIGRTLAGFAIFGLLSSTVYIINDLADVEADRRHPQKRLRPIPSGQLPIPVAYAAVVVFVLSALSLAYLISPRVVGIPGFFVFALTYFLVNIAYSIWLKHIPILDVIVLASFYVIRVGAGVALIHVTRFSPWLYLFTIFLALFLGIGKRRAELNLLANGANAHRPVLEGYTLPLLDQLITIVTTLTIITYSLYTFSAENLPDNHVMMLTIPFVIYGIFRYLHLVQVEHSGGAPEDVLFSDRPLQLTVGLWGIAILAIFYIF